jgi:hypothetical protein
MATCERCKKRLPDFFVMVPNSDTQQTKHAAHSDSERSARVYEIALSAEDDPRHVCDRCTKLVEDRLLLYQMETEEEHKGYVRFLESGCQSCVVPMDPNVCGLPLTLCYHISLLLLFCIVCTLSMT